MNTSYKTTIAGIIFFAVALSVIMKWITVEQATAIMAAAGGAGFAFSKDSNITGGTKSNGQIPNA